jgi:1-acyl-sn-glycerol-3-phosphate acyltransferase
VIARTVAVFCLIAPVSFLYAGVCVLLLPWRGLRIRAGNLYGWVISIPTLRMAGLRLDIHHRERIKAHAPALYVANHTSTLDMWMVMALRLPGVCGVAKKQIVWVPFFGLAYLLSGHLLIDRANRIRAIASMAKAAAVVKRHELGLWMWPEGTRSRDGVLRPLKKGVIHMAIATGLHIVPVITHDADIIWPHGTLSLRPSTARVEVLPPIDTTGWSADTLDEHAAEVHAAMRSTLSARQQGEASPHGSGPRSTG